jgi:CubicO group peptidase (beta-lactamase class C family)
MRTLLIWLAIFLPFLVSGCSKQAVNNNDLQLKTPESQGISSEAVLGFIQAMENERPDEMHSFMLLRHGNIVTQGWWSPYNPDSPHQLYSLSKSFTSTAIGIAQAEGLLSVNDLVISFFPDAVPAEPSDNLKAMRIRDLLKMSTGHNQDATGSLRQAEKCWVEAFLSLPVEHKPGTHFVYNSAATYMLSAIIQKVSGVTLLEYLTPRLFEPLGITGATWDSDPDGINCGGWGLNIRTIDIAKFGQLFLQNGIWNGKQLVPEAWIKEASSYQASNGSNPESDWEQGYGYQFWRCRHNAYRGDGAFGQYCIVMPEKDAVIAITSGTKDMQAILNLIWTHLLPAMQDNPLPENNVAYQALQEKLSGLALSAVRGEETSPVAASVSGKTYTIEENNSGVKSMLFELSGQEKSVTFTAGDGPQQIVPGYGELNKGAMVHPAMGKQVIASSGAWTSADTYQMRTYLFETPFYMDMEFKFNEDEVVVMVEMNVSFGPSGISRARGVAR